MQAAPWAHFDVSRIPCTLNPIHLIEIADESSMPDLRIALVHDWLTGMRGGEKVLEVLCELYPQATLFTLLHNKGSVSETIEKMNIRTSFVDRFPLKATKYRNYLPLFPRAIESFDFSGFDFIFSSSHAVAKGARPAPGALHICYCHTPMRYVWELYEEYFGPGRAGALTRAAMSIVAPRLREWDVRSSDRVNFFIANSRNVADRIRQYYRRPADVIHPPVNVDQFSVSDKDEGYYLIVSALVLYKRVDLAIETFNQLGERLLVVGTGPESKRLQSIANKNIQFLGWQNDLELSKLYAGCRALIFPGIEDFGIVPLEAMASGKPVIAFGKGGVLETVVDDARFPTGLFFREQSVQSLKDSIAKFSTLKFDPLTIRAHAERFARPQFKKRISLYVEDKVDLNRKRGR
ncbi:MAG: glycosyltransferase [Ignavibacteriales bacterium]|nr:glycosyltransferase [Ignavibacteriales bacterium]